MAKDKITYMRTILPEAEPLRKGTVLQLKIFAFVDFWHSLLLDVVDECTCSWWFHSVVFLVVPTECTVNIAFQRFLELQSHLQGLQVMLLLYAARRKRHRICAVEASQVDSKRPFLQGHARLPIRCPSRWRRSSLGTSFLSKQSRQTIWESIMSCHGAS